MIVAVAILVAATTACASLTPPPGPEPDAVPSSGNRDDSTQPPSTPTASSPPSPLSASYPKNEKLLGELSDRQGSASIGPFHPGTSAIGVYVRCFGSGVIHIDVSNAVAFDQDCTAEAADIGTRNVFDIRFAGDFTVAANSEPANTWAVAVTEVAQ